LKKYKSPGSDHILGELIEAMGEKLKSEIHNLINSIRSKEELPHRGKESIIIPVHKKGGKIDCDITAINFIQNFIQYSPLKVKCIY
jgi:hypothetical protein